MESLGEIGLEFDKNWGITDSLHGRSSQAVGTKQVPPTRLPDRRRYQVVPGVPDFTQEYRNAVGTQYEAPGEWFHLNAELYFFGWATSDESGLAKWVLLHIPRYKRLIEEAGGLDRIGKLRNRTRPAARRVSTPFRLRDSGPHDCELSKKLAGLIRFASLTKVLSSLDN